MMTWSSLVKPVLKHAQLLMIVVTKLDIAKVIYVNFALSILNAQELTHNAPTLEQHLVFAGVKTVPQLLQIRMSVDLATTAIQTTIQP